MKAPILTMAALALALVSFGPEARAGEPVFPAGSHIGLVPAGNLAPAKAFPGFADEAAAVKVVVAELPPPAFRAIEAAMRGKPKDAHISRDPAEMVTIASGFAILSHERTRDNDVPVSRWGLLLEGIGFAGLVTVQVPDKAAKTYSPQIVRKMLASVTVRDDVPVAEQMAKLPFRLTDLADFKTMRTIVPGTAVLLTDRTLGDDGKAAPYMIISAMRGGPARDEDRARFAEQAAFSMQGVREVKITSSEPLRFGGQQGYETRFFAKDVATEQDMAMIQWMRFASGGFLLMIAGAPKDQWSDAFPRFRKVRDGLDRP